MSTHRSDTLLLRLLQHARVPLDVDHSGLQVSPSHAWPRNFLCPSRTGTLDTRHPQTIQSFTCVPHGGHVKGKSVSATPSLVWAQGRGAEGGPRRHRQPQAPEGLPGASVILRRPQRHQGRPPLPGDPRRESLQPLRGVGHALQRRPGASRRHSASATQPPPQHLAARLAP